MNVKNTMVILNLANVNTFELAFLIVIGIVILNMQMLLHYVYPRQVRIRTVLPYHTRMILTVLPVFVKNKVWLGLLSYQERVTCCW